MLPPRKQDGTYMSVEEMIELARKVKAHIEEADMKFTIILPRSIVKVDNEGFCYVCGDGTKFTHIDYDVFVCSDACLSQVEDMLFGK